MSRWRVEQHYGFGAARIPIQPEPHRTVRVGLAEGAAAWVEEVTAGGAKAILQRVFGEAVGILFVVLIMAAVAITLARDHSDVSTIEVAFFETPVAAPLPIIETPAPVSVPVPVVIPPKKEIVRSEPEKPPTPKPRPPQQIAEKAMPVPTPVPTRPRPRPVVRPVVAIEAFRAEPSSALPRPDRIARSSVDRPTRPAPRIAAFVAAAPAEFEEAGNTEAFRVAMTRSVASARPQIRPAIAPSPARLASPVGPPPQRLSRTSGPPSKSTRRVRTSTPVFSNRTSPPPESSHVPSPPRSLRNAPPSRSRRPARPSALVARADIRLQSPSPTAISGPARTSRQAPDVPGASSMQVAGVPLAELEACLSDREEDRLKQAVVAAVTTQQECTSGRGTYRFVETKNLNAFLMWIDRAPNRSGTDRCTELGYALECLRGASQQAAR